MKRNRNVDILRGMAILIIIGYHCYVLCGTPWIEHHRLHALMSFGGEFGVTLFFVLSGFGIFWSLYRKESIGKIPGWCGFMKQRCLRIMPQYYCCIGLLLIFQSAALIGKEGVRHILSYLFFVQNLSVSTHGSINGALWAMATIFQFYLIALFLYRMVRKKWILTSGAAAVITVGSKILIYHWILPGLGAEGSAYFVYGRQLISALDNFVFGMAAARVVLAVNEKKAVHSRTIAVVLGTVLSAVGLLGMSYKLSVKGIYGDSVLAYTGHTMLALLLAVLVVCVSLLPQCNGKLSDVFAFLAKYQYGMYLWHMPMIGFLYQGSPAFQWLWQVNFVVFAAVMTAAVIFVAFFMTNWVDSMDYSVWLTGLHRKQAGIGKE